ncbi:MAG: hypothetical protein E7E64_05165 [Clostridium celatum]|uniref:hypothetical protein n=1 Tax=Clostridium tertium TaxID=1559 RepID=UPI002902FF6A|nr:hypothetical protein [Clostridium celatum]
MYNEDYEIKFEDARNMDIYKFDKEITLSELREVFKNLNKNRFSSELRSFYAPIKLIFGNIGIELTILPEGKNNYILDFVVWQYYTKLYDVKRLENGWKPYKFLNYSYNFDIEEDIEEFMYNKLIKIAKENTLFWSKSNNELNILS